SSLRRTAPVHTGAGKLGWSFGGGSADHEYSAEERKVKLWDFAHGARAARLDERKVSAGLFDEAAAIFRPDGIGIAHGRRRNWRVDFCTEGVFARRVVGESWAVDFARHGGGDGGHSVYFDWADWRASGADLL